MTSDGMRFVEVVVCRGSEGLCGAIEGAFPLEKLNDIAHLKLSQIAIHHGENGPRALGQPGEPGA